MLENGLYKKTDTTICLYTLPGVVAEGPFYHSVNSDLSPPVERKCFFGVPAPGLLHL